FKKVFLEAGEEKEVSVKLGRRAFAFWNVNANDWTVESGAFEILVGASSADIRLTAEVSIKAAQAEIPDYSKTAPVYYTGKVQDVPDNQYTAVLGRAIPAKDRDPAKPFSIEDNFEYCRTSKHGAKMYKLLDKLVPDGMAKGIALQTPFRDFISMSGGVFNDKMAEGLVTYLSDGKGGLRKIFSQIPKAIKGIGPLMKSI
ncbi:MAG: fibronectin type III-like domain-contianing protein, partial [Clostridia bacterium]|nr:fibronectin type III-like domain-contianing protein [Clostridia bacterium]